MYEGITYETILQRMLARIPTNVDKSEGSIIWDALAPAAVELQLMYIEFDNIMTEAFADTASRAYLIRRAAERGMHPDPATNAILQGQFAPTDIDMTGKRFNMPNQSINYIVQEMESPGTYRVQCETAGSVGNQYLGQIIPIDYIAGLQTAELTDILIPAKDEQDTESLRQEYLESFKDKAFGGNIRDYLNKTNGIQGVGATKVTPVWNGGGTVKLTILDAQYNKASDALVDLVQQEIDPTKDGHGIGLAPIGHVVTVETAAEIEVNISTVLTFDAGYSWSAIQTQASQMIQDYLLDLRKTWAESTLTLVRIAQIETRLLSIQGVLDISGTAINGAESNLTLMEFEIPVFGGIEA